MSERRPSSGSATPWLILAIVVFLAGSLFLAFRHRIEPRRVLVKHILISFQQAGTRATRTKAEAEALASDTLARIVRGEKFETLAMQLSDDPGEGTYSLVNSGVTPENGEFERAAMVKAFGDVSFKLRVGEVRMTPHDSKDSPYGWHIIKRLK